MVYMNVGNIQKLQDKRDNQQISNLQAYNAAVVVHVSALQVSLTQ